MISEIVKSYPHIKGINFDLPHVIATAPVYDGVSHIAGDMFHQIPNADALLLKVIACILHYLMHIYIGCSVMLYSQTNINFSVDLMMLITWFSLHFFH